MGETPYPPAGEATTKFPYPPAGEGKGEGGLLPTFAPSQRHYNTVSD